jgi:hypothetical protein
MNYIPPPVTYAKINPMGQLIMGLENGTILNAGNVIGPQGLQGVTGATGKCGPTGPAGSVVSKMNINSKGELTYSFSNNPMNIYNAGKVPGITGARGPRGYSIARCDLENQTLVLTTENGHHLIAGKVYGPTGPRGLMGPTGLRGEKGNPFKISRIFTVNNNLIIMDDSNTAYNCGFVGITGPTGPPSLFEDIFIDEDGELNIMSNGMRYTAGNIRGPRGLQGLPGPTGSRGRPGPMLKLHDISLRGDELVIIDEYKVEYNVGKLPALANLQDEIKQLRNDVEQLKIQIQSITGSKF